MAVELQSAYKIPVYDGDEREFDRPQRYVFGLQLGRGFPEHGNAEAVADSLCASLYAGIMSATLFDVRVLIRQDGHVALAVWADQPGDVRYILGATDGETILTPDPALVGDEILASGVRVIPHGTAYQDFGDNRITGFVKRTVAQGEVHSTPVTIEQIAERIRLPINLEVVSSRRKQFTEAVSEPLSA